MDNAAEQQEESLLGTSTLRGILLLGGVATVSFFAWKYWSKIKALESSAPRKPRVIRIPVELPLVQDKSKKK